MSSVSSDGAWLISLPGNPSSLSLQLKPDAGHGRLLGRAKDCDLRLPPDIEEVSRHHARFHFESDRWSVVDLGSRWGTRVNGVKIPPNCPVSLSDGDRINIHPWSFRFHTGPEAPSTTTSIDDTDATHLRTLTGRPSEALHEELLNLLVEGSAALQSAENERSLVAALMDFARRGCGLHNAAVLRAMDTEGGIEVLAAGSTRPPDEQVPVRFSRALLAAAAKGAVAEYSASDSGGASQTLTQSSIISAVCAPLMIGATVYAYLYVQGASKLRRNASGFCQALARLGGLAMANLQRIEIERRAAQMRAELGIAAVTQHVILPRTPIAAGPFVCHGRSLPGDGYLGGDFFDVQVLAGGRLAVSLGDVSGHGVQSSILMAVAQGFLHASMTSHGDLALAASGLNRFVADRSHQGQFITLWLGILDPADLTLTYVNAGHGHAYLMKADNEWQVLDKHAGLILGIDADSHYAAAKIPLARGERLLVCSDGILEQRRPDSGPEDQWQQFGVAGIRAALVDSPSEGMVDRLVGAVQRFAGSTELVDDVTALLVHWS